MMKTDENLKKVWLENYKVVPKALKKLKGKKTAAAAFNANIDAVLKIKPVKFLRLLKQEEMCLKDLQSIKELKLKSGKDVLRGVFKSFSQGIAEEWISEDIAVYDWMVENLGYDRLQIGGQGGIVANALAVLGLKKVYAHCNSLPKMQAEQFVKLKNLVSFDAKGKEKPAYKINRKADVPLIHWIIEFNKGDVWEIEGQRFVCPKANRFIATYDPLNLNLVRDEAFVQKVSKAKTDCIVVSGYHALTASAGGEKLIKESLPMIKEWAKSEAMLHVELASTQDLKIRKAIFEKVAPLAASIGCNERETIDFLEIISEKKLAKLCQDKTTAGNMLQAILALKEKIKVPRVQLHMFGLYITVQDKDFTISPKDSRKGMMLAATVSASKAGLGDIDKYKNLMWAKGKEVSDVGLKELEDLAKLVKDKSLLETGLFEYQGFDVIAVPTILIEKPKTLVGMGDTISSVSLIGSM